MAPSIPTRRAAARARATGSAAEQPVPRHRLPTTPWPLRIGKALVAMVTVGSMLGALTLLASYYWTNIPQAGALMTARATVVYYADGKTEIGRFSIRNRVPVSLDDVPRHLQLAVLSAEDRSFELHRGVSPRDTARAAVANLRGEPLQGASTITQQYVKALSARTGRGWAAKYVESLAALKLERSVSKRQILQGYLNAIYFGRNSYGVQAASRAWFGIDVAELDVSQAAFVAGIINSPERYDPMDGDRPTKEARRRWNYVLDGMVKQGWLDRTTRDGLVFPKVRPTPTPPDPVSGSTADQRGYLLPVVRRELRRTLGMSDSEIDRAGLKVVTTIDPRVQTATVAAAERARRGTKVRDLRIGAVAMDPLTGEVKALYGGPGTDQRQRSTATRDVAQLGTAAAPFILSAALESGLTADTQVSAPRSVRISPTQRLTNPDGLSHGYPGLGTAMAAQWPTALHWVGKRVGPDAVRRAAVRAGLPDDTRGLKQQAAFPLSLASPRVIDLAAVEAGIGQGGTRPVPHLVSSVTGPGLRDARRREVALSRGLSAQVAGTVGSVQSQTLQEWPDVAGRLRRCGTPADASGAMAGTSPSRYSSWFAGFTPGLSVAVGMHRGTAYQPLPLVGLRGITAKQYQSIPSQVWAELATVDCRPDPDYLFRRPGSAPAPAPGSAPAPAPVGLVGYSRPIG
jgi:membrane peptidoglycan carboxypeptidase